MAASAALLRPFGERHLLEYEHAAVIAVEHAFILHVGYGHDLDLLMEIATTMPHLRFADFCGYMRFLCAQVELSRQRPVA
jgi:hypothetical protein